MTVSRTSLFSAKRFSLWAMALLTAFTLSFATTSQAADDGAKVVFHVDFKNPTRYSATLTAINNILNFYDSQLMDADVELVFVGYGLRFTTDDDLKGTPYVADKALFARRAELKGRLESLIKVRGVKVWLCDKTRSDVKLAKSKIYPGIKMTPSGVAKIAILESQGYSYLKIQ